MSHGKERKEKICLNCGADLYGQFCHICGQENREPKDSVWGLVSHFFYDITHFDGKFFNTVGHLIRKPGFLSTAYMVGKRASYLNPIRMYVFTSAFFFIVFFTLYDVKDVHFSPESAGGSGADTGFSMQQIRNAALAKARTQADSQSIDQALGFTSRFMPDSVAVDSSASDMRTRVDWGGSEKYHSVSEYDSMQHALPAKDRDSWITTRFYRKSIGLRNRYRGEEGQLVRDLVEKFMHSIPSLLFVSLPLFALYLKWLYFRHKRYYYVDHGIFLIHLYIFTFLFLLIYFGIDKLANNYPLGIFTLVKGLLMLYGIYYAFRAMYKFYNQGVGKTLLKFFILNLLSVSTLFVLFGIFFIISLYRL